MTHSALPPKPEAAESTASELQALYREAAQAEPDARLDRSILDAARAELRSAGEAKARRRPWWQGWLPAASALAIVFVGVSLTWRVMDQQEQDLHQEMKAAEAVREPSVAGQGRGAPAQDAADALPLPRTPPPVAEKTRRVESTAAGDAPPGAPEPMAAAAPAVPAPMTPTAPLVAEEAAKKSDRAEKEELQQRRDANAAAAASPASQAGKLEAGGPAIGASGATAADSLAGPTADPVAKSALPPPDAATPEAWLKQVRELRAAGRSAEAAQSLARFRARYPDFALPDDLLKLK